MSLRSGCGDVKGLMCCWNIRMGLEGHIKMPLVIMNGDFVALEGWAQQDVLRLSRERGLSEASANRERGQQVNHEFHKITERAP